MSVVQTVCHLHLCRMYKSPKAAATHQRRCVKGGGVESLCGTQRLHLPWPPTLCPQMAQHAEASGVDDVTKIRNVLWEVGYKHGEYSHKAQILLLLKGLPYIETVLEQGTARDTAAAMHAEEVNSEWNKTLRGIEEVLNHAKAGEDHELQANATEALVPQASATSKADQHES
eukprot:jgi/Chlat1/4846/Chrsp31S04876